MNRNGNPNIPNSPKNSYPPNTPPAQSQPSALHSLGNQIHSKTRCQPLDAYISYMNQRLATSSMPLCGASKSGPGKKIKPGEKRAIKSMYDQNMAEHYLQYCLNIKGVINQELKTISTNTTNQNANLLPSLGSKIVNGNPSNIADLVTLYNKYFLVARPYYCPNYPPPVGIHGQHTIMHLRSTKGWELVEGRVLFINGDNNKYKQNEQEAQKTDNEPQLYLYLQNQPNLNVKINLTEYLWRNSRASDKPTIALQCILASQEQDFSTASTSSRPVSASNRSVQRSLNISHEPLSNANNVPVGRPETIRLSHALGNGDDFRAYMAGVMRLAYQIRIRNMLGIKWTGVESQMMRQQSNQNLDGLMGGDANTSRFKDSVAPPLFSSRPTRDDHPHDLELSKNFSFNRNSIPHNQMVSRSESSQLKPHSGTLKSLSATEMLLIPYTEANYDSIQRAGQGIKTTVSSSRMRTQGLIGDKIWSQTDTTSLKDTFQQFSKSPQDSLSQLSQLGTLEISSQMVSILLDYLNTPNKQEAASCRPNVKSCQCLLVLPGERTKVYRQIIAETTIQPKTNERPTRQRSAQFAQSAPKINLSYQLEHIFIRHYCTQKNPNQYEFIDISVHPSHRTWLKLTTEPLTSTQTTQHAQQPSRWKWLVVEDEYGAKLTVTGGNYQSLVASPNLLLASHVGGFHNSFLQNAKKFLVVHDEQENEVMLNTFLFQNQYLQSIMGDGQVQFMSIIDESEWRDQESIVSVVKGQKTSDRFVSKDFLARNGIVSQENSNDILKHRYQLVPFEKPENPKLHHQSRHNWLLDGQWEFTEKGKLKSINYEKIAAQSTILKTVLSRMGSSIFSGKAPSFSLPVTVFGPESMISRIASGYGYGPAFLQKTENMTSLDRFVQVLLFSVGFTLLSLAMDKPFNPVIGETYQGLIDGCPVYGEQTSHHPPISSIFMVGRGYQLWGSYESKVSLGLNSASGSNDGITYLRFKQSGDKIRFNQPPGSISGVIYGDRELIVEGKTQVYDQSNQLFCHIQWGKGKGAKESFYDYFQAQIYEMPMEFYAQPNSPLDKVKPTSSGGVKKGLYSGRLSREVCFNDKVLYSFDRKPYLLASYEPSLESDSFKRKDLQYLMVNDKQNAQTEKDNLENIQRADRKLRGH